MPNAQARWSRLTPDERVVLTEALEDALRRPQRVGDYVLEFHRLRPQNRIYMLHRFRFGYAHYEIVNIDNRYFLYDLWLDEEVVAAE